MRMTPLCSANVSEQIEKSCAWADVDKCSRFHLPLLAFNIKRPLLNSVADRTFWDADYLNHQENVFQSFNIFRVSRIIRRRENSHRSEWTGFFSGIKDCICNYITYRIMDMLQQKRRRKRDKICQRFLASPAMITRFITSSPTPTSTVARFQLTPGYTQT